MSTEEFLKGVEQEESASRQRQFESHEATASALAEQELATTQHESSAAQREPPTTEHEPLAAHDQHLADEAIVSNRLVLPPTFHSFVWVGWMDECILLARYLSSVASVHLNLSVTNFQRSWKQFQLQ